MAGRTRAQRCCVGFLKTTSWASMLINTQQEWRHLASILRCVTL